MHRDVIGVPVEAVRVERDDDVRLEAVDGVEDVRFEPRFLDPGQHTVLVVEQYEVTDAENPCGIPQLALPSVTKPLAVVSRAVLAMREAEQRDPNPLFAAAREQASARE